MASESEQLDASSDSFDPLASIYSSEESVPDPSAPVFNNVEDFVNKLDTFNTSLNTLDGWMKNATGEMEAIRAAAGSMLPEDRVARTMDLQEDIAAKVEVIKKNAETELALLPQGKSCLLFLDAFTSNVMFVSKSYF